MKTLLILVALVALAFAANTGPQSYITVYPDGYAGVNITENVTAFVPANISVIGVPQGLTVSYSNGSPVVYSYSSGVVKIIPDMNGSVAVSYYTYSIVSKNNISWFVNFTSPYSAVVQLPHGAELVYLSGIPSSVEAVNGTLYLTLASGRWEIGYILPPPSKVTQVSPAPSVFSLTPLVYAVPGVIIVIVGLVYALYTKNKKRESAVERSMDAQILEFIKKKGGTAKESEIRESLILPKTSAWRAIKRLERQGLVRVEKRGKENYVILVNK